MFLNIVFLCGFAFFLSIQSAVIENINSLADQKDKFMYFAYGCDMLDKGLQMHTPSSVRLGPSEIKDYRLDFNTFSEYWDGSRATIVPQNGSNVFGTIWHLDVKELRALDRHEGVRDGVYFPFGVPCEIYGIKVFARAYMLADQPSIPYNNFTNPPQDRRPSKTLLQCMVKGAIETKMDALFVDYLRKLKHNGKVITDLQNRLELDDTELYS